MFKKIKQPMSEKKERPSKNQIIHKAATISASDLTNLKIGDIISFGNSEEKVYEPKWLKPNENPYKMEVFDCREYALKMTSTTQDPKIANNFLNSRKSDGKNYLGKFPENGIKCEVK